MRFQIWNKFRFLYLLSQKQTNKQKGTCPALGNLWKAKKQKQRKHVQQSEKYTCCITN